MFFELADQDALFPEGLELPRSLKVRDGFLTDPLPTPPNVGSNMSQQASSDLLHVNHLVTDRVGELVRVRPGFEVHAHDDHVIVVRDPT